MVTKPPPCASNAFAAPVASTGDEVDEAVVPLVLLDDLVAAALVPVALLVELEELVSEPPVALAALVVPVAVPVAVADLVLPALDEDSVDCAMATAANAATMRVENCMLKDVCLSWLS